MERIFEALEKNNNLTNEVKQRIQTDIILLVNTFSNVNIDNVAQKIENLKIEALPKLGEYEDIKIVDDSKILVSKTALETKDAYNISMQCVLKALFPSHNQKLEAIHNGMTEMIANALTGGSSESDEYLVCELLNCVIEPENENVNILLNSYLNGNFSLIIPVLEEKLGLDLTNDLLNMSNQNYMRRKIDGQSLFPDMEKYLIDAFYKQNPSIKATNDFDNRLILDPRFFDEKANDYMGLYDVANYYDNLRASYYTNYQVEEQVKTL